MHDQENELDDALYQALKKHCAAGDAAVERNDFASAIRSFQQAFALLPEPYEDWEASTWVLFSLGEAQFFNEQYAAARESLAAAMHCPGAIGNPLMHLRLGQVHKRVSELRKSKRRTPPRLHKCRRGNLCEWRKEVFSLPAKISSPVVLLPFLGPAEKPLLSDK